MVRSYDKGNSPKNIGGIVAFELLQYRALLGEKDEKNVSENHIGDRPTWCCIFDWWLQ